MRIQTNIEATMQNKDILNSVIGQMSDGIWENTRSMEKYWRSIRFEVENGMIVLIDRDHVCENLLDFIANKIKQIIKIEINDGARICWDRHSNGIPHYLDRSNVVPVTVGDCYRLYDQLKNRNISKYHYSSYRPFKVTIHVQGQILEINVNALDERDAKHAALEKISSGKFYMDAIDS